MTKALVALIIVIAISAVVLGKANNAVAPTAMNLNIVSVTRLEFSFWSSPRPNENCSVVLGPSQCPAYGTPFIGSDKSTLCKACTLACKNMKLFKDDNDKTTCTLPYFNYGCHEKYLCIDERAKFKPQFNTAVAFCLTYNGCKINKKYKAKDHEKFLNTKIVQSHKQLIQKMLDFNNRFSFEDQRALLFQSTPSRYLLRFKLAQDIIDARLANNATTLEQFISRSELVNMKKIPTFIVKNANPNWMKAEAKRAWEQITWVQMDLLPESFFYKFVNAWANATFSAFEKRREKLGELQEQIDHLLKNKNSKYVNQDIMDIAYKAAKESKKRVAELFKEQQKISNLQTQVFSKLSGKIYNFFNDLADKLVARNKAIKKRASIGRIVIELNGPRMIALKAKKYFVAMFKSKAMRQNASLLYNALFLDEDDANLDKFDDTVDTKELLAASVDCSNEFE